MGFLAEMLAVAVVWLSSFALSQFGVAIDAHGCPSLKAHHARIVARSPRGLAGKPAPVAVNAVKIAPRQA